jgi:hypothetical protein
MVRRAKHLKTAGKPQPARVCGLFGDTGKRLRKAFVICQRMQNAVICYIIAVDSNGRDASAASTQSENAPHTISLYPSSFQETP